MGLAELGWSDFFAGAFAPHAVAGLKPGRITSQEKLLYIVHDGNVELAAELSGRFAHEAGRQGGFPAVGDWVALRPHSGDKAVIHALLPRRTAFTRKDPGERTEEQVIAANVDTIFLVTGLDQEFNPRRIERYVTVMRASGATPVIVVNKTDLCPDVAPALDRIGPAARGIAVHPVSAATEPGLAALRPYLRPGETVAFVGSSGVGKSTIINRLLGAERQATGAVSGAVGKGRHVTTRRELIPLPGGGLLMDTPGLRELQVWCDRDDVRAAFADVDELAGRCRFRDCRHQDEPGCAVRSALAAGELSPERFHNYQKLERELDSLARRRRGARVRTRRPRPAGD